MIEYFTTYNLFAYGLYGSIIGMIYFIAICTASVAPYSKKPLQQVFAILLPVYFIGFALSFIGFPPITTGIIVVITYLISIKICLGMSTRDIISVAISFFGLIAVFSITPHQFFNFLFGGVCIYLFIQGKVTMKKINQQIALNIQEQSI